MMTQPPEDSVKTLQGMGFMRSDVLEALKVSFVNRKNDHIAETEKSQSI